MKSLAWILCVIFAFSGLAFADTTFVAAGNVSGLWDSSHSPFIIQGEIVIPPHDTLTIGPGVRVYFDGYYGLYDSLGVLNVLGAEEDSVVFTTDTIAHPDKWRGIRISHPAQPVNLSYCVFEYVGHDTLFNWFALNIIAANVTILNSSFRYCGEFYYAGPGAIQIDESFVTFNSCTFHSNQGLDVGAVSIYTNCEVTFDSCLFDQNRGINGGALGAQSELHTICTNCVFQNNGPPSIWPGESQGGAIMGQASLTDCEFVNNFARLGGALCGYNFRATRCLFSGNHAYAEGGAMNEANGEFDHCVFANNTAGTLGGVAVITENTFLNCTFVGNSCHAWGSVLYSTRQMPIYLDVINSIFAFNGPGGAYAYPPTRDGAVRNCLFFRNATNFFQSQNQRLGLVDTTNMNGDSCDAYQNLFLDPLFTDTSAGDYHLTANSLCIDAGSLLSPHDPDSTIADIGALYYDQRISDAGAPALTVPSSFALHQNYPNPFNSETHIAFDLPRASDVHLEVFDLLGRLVTTLVSEPMVAGMHEVGLSSKDLASGIYIYRMQAGEFSQSRKIIVIK